MILSYDMFQKLKKLIQDDAITISSYHEDPLVLAFETGKASGMALMAQEIWEDLFGKDENDK